MRSKLKLAFIELQQPIAIATLVICFLWAITDINSRFFHTSKNKILNLDSNSYKFFAGNKINTEQKTKIWALYSQFELPQKQEKTEVKQSGLSEEQQAAQSGTLQEVFAGDNKIELKAVIGDANSKPNNLGQSAQHFALLLITNVKTNVSKIVRYENLANVHGFKLTIKNNTQVILEQKRIETEQKITLTMYKTTQ